MDKNQDGDVRSLFSHPRMVRDLIRGFLAEEWIGWLDLDSLERYEPARGEPPRDRLDEVLIWRLRWQGGSAWVYFLLRTQRLADPATALHMGFYRELLHQDLLRQGAAAWLPVALPVVLYDGEARWQAPRDALELFLPLPPALQRHAPRTRYLLVDLRRDTIRPAAGEDNLVALLCRLERSRTPEAVDALLERLISLVSGPGDEALRRSWSSFLGNLLSRRFPDLFSSEGLEAWAPEGVLA